MKALDKVIAAATQDPKLYADKEKIDETFGHNPAYLEDRFGITKSDLIRLERAGMAMKARYVTQNKTGRTVLKDPESVENPYVDGPHRVRWFLFKRECENEICNTPHGHDADCPVHGVSKELV